MNKTLTNVLLILCFLAALNFFAFYWTNAAGITSDTANDSGVGIGAWIFMLIGFFGLAVIGCDTESKLADVFFNLGMIIAFVNFFVFLWLGPIMSVVQLPRDPDGTAGLEVLFGIMAFIAVICLALRAESKNLKEMFNGPSESEDEPEESSKSKSESK